MPGFLHRHRRLVTGSVAVALVTGTMIAWSAQPSLAGTTSTTTTTTLIPTTTSMATTTTIPTQRYGVGLVRCRFVDRSRTVPNYVTNPPTVLDHRRVLMTEIRYPTLNGTSSSKESLDVTPAPSTGGFAMIVFAPGYDVVPDDYRALLDAWVRRGFVVAAPIFPDTNPTQVAKQPHADVERDVDNQPADLAFVTRQILADDTTLQQACPRVFGLVRPTALALAGHSDGGDTVGLLAYSTGRDPQHVAFQHLRAGLAFRAAIIMSGAQHGAAPYRALAMSPSLMVIQSAQDRCNAPGGALDLYREVKVKDKWFLELMKAHHFTPFNGSDHSAFVSVVNVTSQYLEWRLTNSSTPSSVMQAGDARPVVARIYYDGAGPSIAPVDLPALCSLT